MYTHTHYQYTHSVKLCVGFWMCAIHCVEHGVGQFALNVVFVGLCIARLWLGPQAGHPRKWYTERCLARVCLSSQHWLCNMVCHLCYQSYH